MQSKLIRVQLTIFAFVTVVMVSLMAIFYIRVPSWLGIGEYHVTADLEAGGGIYESANVTYRGVTIGRVDSVRLTDTGVDAGMELNSDVQVPSNVIATVKSVSAIGEQYIDLVPPEEGASSDMLADNSRIERKNTRLPQDVSGLLRQADDLVNSIGDSRLQDLLRETFRAFNGSGPELSRLIQSSRLFIDQANQNWPETAQLIDQVGPFLDAQIRSGDDIRALAANLATLTGEVQNADPQLRTTLEVLPGVADQANYAFTGLRPTFPVLSANLANLGRIGVIYHKSIEQVLVIMPALFAALLTVAGGVPTDEGGKLDFKIDLGDPPPCSVGFIPSTDIRSPADTTLRELPTDLYCKVPQNDPSVVRGARNYPCMEFPGKRAPTIQLCRDPVGYVPLGNNPWRGPTVPAGTPVTDGENILPPNRFPYIPPENDPDPGIPYAPGYLPEGATTGPGPEPHQPWPVQAPPVDGPAPPPLPYNPPAPYPPQPPLFPYPNEIPAPPPPVGTGPEPQASAQDTGLATYDQNGTFVAPNGDVGEYSPGVEGGHPPETWIDLMRDPRAL